MKNETYIFTVKGVIFHSLGGYGDESQVKERLNKSDEIIKDLSEYMSALDLSIINTNNGLKFVPNIRKRSIIKIWADKLF